MASSTEHKLRQYLKRVTVELGQTRQRLREVEERYQEPVAVVSMACRYPGGVTSPEELWELVASGGDAIGPFPTDRGWDLGDLYNPDPDHPGTSYVREGGFLYDADRFDAEFFGISPREALAMEPQQRLLLEISWELLERAGIDPRTLKGSATGIYAGAGLPGFRPPHIESSTEGHLLTGNALSVLSGRVAFTLGLEGPAVSVDTACSSSLVALHLACQALRQGECSLAMAGGVTVMATPFMFTEFSRQRGLAADGRCKPFAEAADGTGFSEGVGLVLLERLSDARRNGHQVLAVIRGSAINQDGASNGLTAPKGPAQERVIRQALDAAGLSAAEVDVVEAHGTGTRLGDPIEAGALLATYGRDRPEERPLWLGSIKSNIGHTQGASGVAGVIKMVMALRHEKLPATLHVDRPSTHVDWSSGAIRLLTEPVDWARTASLRRAAVSAFGMSGTNAHLILEEAVEADAAAEPVPAGDPVGAGDVIPWTLSARTQKALQHQAAALATHTTNNPHLPPADVGWSLATRRTVFEHRAVIIGTDRHQLIEATQALAAGRHHPRLIHPGTPVTTTGQTVWLFSGQGSQRPGMGAELYKRFPTFKTTFDHVCDLLNPHLHHPLQHVVLTGLPDHPDLLHHTTYTQTGLFALQVALAHLLNTLGAHPDMVIGHSIGEITAAHIAGILDLPDACHLVATRATLMGQLPPGGAMAAIQAGAQELADDLQTTHGKVTIAALNTPDSTVISGPTDLITTITTRWAAKGRKTKHLPVSHAFHSPLMDPILDDFHHAITHLTYHPPAIPLISNLTGKPADHHITTPHYWTRHIREPVHFHPAITHTAPHTTIYLELGPDPILATATRHTLHHPTNQTTNNTPEPLTTATLNHKQPETTAFTTTLAQLHTHQTTIHWHHHLPTNPPPQPTHLPTYPFQHQRYRLNGQSGPSGDPASLGLVSAGHPLLGAAVEVADERTHVLTGRLSIAGGGWLADHQVLGTVLVPGAALVEWALRAADEVGCGAVEELVLQAPLVLPASGGVRVQVVVEATGSDGRRDVRVYSRPDHDDGGSGWICHAAGVLSAEPAAPAEESGRAWPTPGARPVDVSDFYARAAAAGYEYGPAFRGLRAVWRDGADLLAEIVLPEAAGDRAGFGIHPALLDAALHPGLLIDEDDGRLWLPFAWNGISLWAGEATTLRVRMTPDRQGARGERSLRVLAFDAVGAPVLSVDSVVLHPADPERLRAAGDRGAQGLFTVDWTTPGTEFARPGPGTDDRNDWVTLGRDIFGVRSRSFPDLDALVAAFDAGEPVPSVVLAGVPAAGDGLGAVEHTLALVRGWLAEPRLGDARLVMITRDAVAAGAPDPAGAAVWGLIRSAQAEEPDRFILVDLDLDHDHHHDRDDGGDDVVAAIRAAMAAGEPQMAVRAGRLLVPRLTRAGGGEGDLPVLDPAATVLITGGTGMAGSAVAEHLVRTRGVRHLVLVGRRGRDAPGAHDLHDRLTGLGAQVRVVAADVADPAAVHELVEGIDPAHPLRAVVHAAGVLDDAMIAAQSPERLARVWAAKATAARNLHNATADLRLDMFVMFSSAAACVGSLGQANYAAANAFCDALAAHRQAAGLPGLSVGWGLWADASGMTGKLSEADLTRLSRLGSTPLRTDRALELLDAACRHGGPYLLAADLDRRALAARPPHTLPPPLRALGTAGTGPVRRSAATAGRDGSTLASRLAGLDEGGRLDAVLEVVAGCVAGTLGYRSADEIRTEAPFKDLGFDSLTAVELRNRLSTACGLRLPATLVFDHPTPQALARFLCTRLSGADIAAKTPIAAATGPDEPVAIVAMACRYPGGVSSAEDLWELVAAGRDAIGPFPTGRGWDLANLFHPDPDHPGTSYAREGGFVRGAEEFDARFFEVNPREALAMDPQQRLLLETSWELLERAGIDAGTLKGSRTGVYAGVMYHDYAAGLARGDARLEGYAMLAGSGSVVSGRVAYTLGLEGPAVTVDTACSSSLVAMHLAAQALRQGECDLALAGGVTVLATPEVFTEFSRQRGLAPDGRCKPFAASADGTGWAEGAGLVLLERLSDARRHGHRVLALVRGSAINQDGASNGLTAPNGPSQERVIRQALANARLAADQIDVVEGHGTGTTLGDPIEAQALLATYGRERPVDRPLWLGSIKSNMGHTQAAAGVAGVIKMVMAMRHGVAPASLHIDEPSPHVDWQSGAVRLLTEPVPWPRGERPRRAGVSSFGVSGTNAHLILEEPLDPVEPEGQHPPARMDGVVPWVVSARGDEALRGQAAALAEFLAADPQVSPADVGWSLVTTRARFDHRAVVLGRDRDRLLAGVRALAAAEPHPSVIRSTAAAAAGKTVFLFSGQGSQRPGMGAGLYERFPVFAGAFDEVCGLLDAYLEHPLREVMFAGLPDHPDLLNHTTYAQAGLFALQIALARLLASLGVRPDIVIGHSVGEIAAAQLAGVFDLADACRLVAARATLMGRLPAGGAMAAIQAGAEELADDIDSHAGQVAIAALNTPDSTVISGPAEAVSQVSAAWRGRGRKTKALAVSHAFHSPLMDPILTEFTEAIEELTYHRPAIPLISNLTGLPADDHIATPGYWARHIRRPVRFAPSITHIAAEAGVFLELGPDPVLATAAQHTLDRLDGTQDEQADRPSAAGRPVPPVLSALTGNQPEPQALAHTLARLHTAGRPVNWTGWFPDDPPARIVELPTYAFQRERYWLTSDGRVGDVSAAGLRRVEHPLLPAAIAPADGGLLLTGRLAAAGDQAWLADHRVMDTVLLPGAALAEWALRAADEAGCGGVAELVLQAPLVLPESGGVQVQVVVDAAGADDRRQIRVYSRPDRDDGPLADAEWTCHAVGVLAPEAPAPDDGLDGDWPPPDARPIDVSDFYERVAMAGYEYGPAFRGLRAAWRDGPDVLAEIVLPEAAGDPGGFGIHPALLDAALHPGTLIGEPGGDDRVWLPFAWNGISLWAGQASTIRVRVSLEHEDEQGERGVRVRVADATGAPVLAVDSVVARPADIDRLKMRMERGPEGRFALDWTALPVAAEDPCPVSPEPGRHGWAVLGQDEYGLAGSAACHPDLAALVAAIEAGAPVPSTVLTCVPRVRRACDHDAETDADAGLTATANMLELIQGWLAEPRLADARLVVVTRAAVITGAADAEVDTTGAAVWGLVRSAQWENPGRFLLLDVDPDASGAARALRRAAQMQEPQIALRSDRVLVPRLVRADDRGPAPLRDQAWRLGLEVPGTVDNVCVVACPEVLEPLGPGQVRIEVRAAGINFRDVLITLGMYPGEGIFRGSEGAGLVTEIGPGVTGVSVGDRVMGLFEGAFGPVAVADARAVAPIPAGWGWREAAAVPVVFLTAWFGLVELAGLRAGESVLIHAATGGVGMAAVQIARYLGAQVFATASPGKHGVLEGMGVDAAHRASSRDLGFEEAFRRASGGRGVDVVLNGLAGAFTDASLRLVARGGRFVEMGKTDIRDPEQVAVDHPGIHYQAFDLMIDAGLDRTKQMLARLAGLFAAGTLTPAPVRAWPLARAREALRYLSQARHVGKLVLDVPVALDRDGTVLVTGGTGTLGGLVAEHVVRAWGVGRLVLVSRRGLQAPGAQELVARLGGLGADVRVVAADVTDPEVVAELVGGVDPGHPLTGVIHAAGVLDDGVITALSAERLGRVWAAKATAAWNLHNATAHLPLGVFVLFSSSAATLGSPGQANYAAANAFCDALAAYRQALGLPGVSIGWGLWADASGMTGTLTETDRARMSRSGMRALSGAQGLALLDSACRHGDPHLIAMNLDMRALAAQSVDTLPAALRALAAGNTGVRTRRTAATVQVRAEDWAGRLAGLSGEEQHRILLNLVRGHVATVLGHADPEAVQAEASFKELGFDSLTAVELRNQLSAATGLRLPPALIFDYPQVGVLADHLRRRIHPDNGASPGVTDIEPVLDELARLESTLTTVELGDGDSRAVTARLEALLAQWKAARAPERAATATETLQAASADQLLDLIDNELGGPAGPSVTTTY